MTAASVAERWRFLGKIHRRGAERAAFSQRFFAFLAGLAGNIFSPLVCFVSLWEISTAENRRAQSSRRDFFVFLAVLAGNNFHSLCVLCVFVGNIHRREQEGAAFSQRFFAFLAGLAGNIFSPFVSL